MFRFGAYNTVFLLSVFKIRIFSLFQLPWLIDNVWWSFIIRKIAGRHHNVIFATIVWLLCCGIVRLCSVAAKNNPDIVHISSAIKLVFNWILIWTSFQCHLRSRVNDQRNQTTKPWEAQKCPDVNWKWGEKGFQSEVKWLVGVSRPTCYSVETEIYFIDRIMLVIFDSFFATLVFRLVSRVIR